MNAKSMLLIALLLVVALVTSNALYTIKESERGIKIQFGRIVDANLEPGLGWKWPILQEVRKFDSRVMALDLRSEEYITQEKKRLIVDSYVMWRIKNVAKFYTATGGMVARAERLLQPSVNDGLRNKFGERTVYEVVSGERERLMVDLTREVDELTEREFGIEIVDIRVKRIDLPPTVSEAVYDRMRAERQREAREHRSKGKELAEGIRADADRQVRIIQAQAYEEAEMIRGEGDAQAANIYAKAYGEDAGFYDFSRSLTAYKNVFQSKKDLMVLAPEGEFFQYLKQVETKQK